MNAHKIEVTLTEDGKLILENIPFKKGDTVEVIVLDHSVEGSNYPLRDRQPYQYDDPFENLFEKFWDRLSSLNFRF
jgi:hypothetical protein